MVTEQVAEVAEEVQPEVPEVAEPNSAPEAEAEQAALLQGGTPPEDNFEDVLELLNQPAEGADAGATPQTKDLVAASKPKSEEEIRTEERQRVLEETNQQAASRNRNSQIEGMRTSYRQMDSDVETILADVNLTEGERERKVKNRLAQHNGHWNELYQNDVQQAHLTGVDAVRNGVIQATAQQIGKDAAEEVIKANHQSWDSYLEDYGERYAKKKGYLPPSEAEKKFSDGQRDTLTKLKKLGIELPRGGEAKNIGTPRGGSTRNDAAKLADPSTPITEIEAIRARQRRDGG